MPEPAALQELGEASTDKRVDEFSHFVFERGELFVARVTSAARKVVRMPTSHMEPDAGKRRDQIGRAHV